MDCQLIRRVRMARNAEISRLRGTSIASLSIKRFSLIDCFSRSRGYRGLLSSICYDYNYHSNDELRLRSILPYHDTTYLCLSWASITYTYDDMYTLVGRHHEGG
jgi:hypothetical protein